MLKMKYLNLSWTDASFSPKAMPANATAYVSIANYKFNMQSLIVPEQRVKQRKTRRKITIVSVS